MESPWALDSLNFWGIEMVQQRTELLTPYGRVEVIALRSGDGPRSTVLVNVGCYYTLADAGARDLQVVYFRLVLVLV